MTLGAGLAIYFIIWWIMLFCVLPLDVQSQAEKGDVVSGTEPGAPVAPGLIKKAIITTILSCIVFAGVYAVWVWAEL